MPLTIRAISIFVVAIVSVTVVALYLLGPLQYFWSSAPADPVDYYKNINFSLRGNALRTALYKLISVKTSVSYTPGIWNFYSSHWIGLGGCPANRLKDVYSKMCWVPGTDQCGSSQNDCYNREHSWCKSYWGSGTTSATPYTDLFHVFPSDGYANSKRSNYPLGFVSNPTYTSPNGGKLGPCSPATGFSGTCFEVANDFKGNYARAYFYISTAYMGKLTCCNIDGVNGAEIQPWLKNVLLQWHYSDPVDEDEKYLNEAIYNNYQKK